MKHKLELEQLIDWRKSIERLAKDFLDGRAEVDPREYPKTCEHCGLEALCRIQEHQGLVKSDDDAEAGESEDE